MLNVKKFNQMCRRQKIGIRDLATALARGGRSTDEATTAIRNWQRGLMSPIPTRADVEQLAQTLGVETQDISEWKSSYRYAPMSARKVRLVTALINGRDVQDALDLLKFTNKRAAQAVRKVLQSAVANADEQEADVDNLVVTEARADQAGRRIGTKAWHPKDRGRAHPIRKEASHIYVTVSQAD
jgi:large subunit ribosomal protein L22